MQPNQPRQGTRAARRSPTPPLLLGTPPRASSHSLTPPVSFADQEGGRPGAPKLVLGAKVDSTQSGGGTPRVSGETQLQMTPPLGGMPRPTSGGNLQQEKPGRLSRGEHVTGSFGSRMSEGGSAMDQSNSASYFSKHSSRHSGTGTSMTGSNGSRGRLQGGGTPESRTPQRQVSQDGVRQSPAAHIDSNTDQRMMAMLEMLADCNFLIQSDAFITCGTKFLSVMFLAGATVFAYLALQADRAYKLRDNAEPIVYVAGTLIMTMIALCTFLRVRSPTSLNIARVNGDWCFILHRMAMKPVVRPLRTLEAFVETFGFGSRAQLGFWGKMFGHATSRKGSLHLFFPESANSTKAMAICCSLEDPHSFFIRLRDLMIATSHHLSSITADYVGDWDQEDRPEKDEEDFLPVHA